MGGDMIIQKSKYQYRDHLVGYKPPPSRRHHQATGHLVGGSPSHLVLVSAHLGIWFHTRHLVIYLLDQLNFKKKESGHVVLEEA